MFRLLYFNDDGGDGGDGDDGGGGDGGDGGDNGDDGGDIFLAPDNEDDDDDGGGHELQYNYTYSLYHTSPRAINLGALCNTSESSLKIMLSTKIHWCCTCSTMQHHANLGAPCSTSESSLVLHKGFDVYEGVSSSFSMTWKLTSCSRRW